MKLSLNLNLINYIQILQYSIFNQNVAQFSTRIIFNKENKLYAEAFTVYSYLKENKYIIKRRIKCIVLVDQDLAGIFDIVETLGLPTFSPPKGRTRSIWKIRCELKPINKYLSKINRIRVGITDIKELNKLYNSGKYKDKEYLLSFHWTNAYDERVAKKKRVAHCVHTIYDLDRQEVNRIKSWLKIQKSIGIDRVKLYFSRVEDSTIKSKLLQEFRNYLEIVDYRLDFDYICKTPLLHIRSSSIVDNITMNYLYENCQLLQPIF